MNEKELREIRRRFRPDKCNIGNVRGCFVNDKGEIVTTFNQSLAVTSNDETERILAVMKKALSGRLKKNLIDINFSTSQVEASEEHGLLMKLKKSALSDDEAVESFFKKAAESISIGESYVILLACDNYDVFSYSQNLERDEDSSQVYSYIVCSICPVKRTKGALSFHAYDNSFKCLAGDTVICAPEIGFLFPAFDDRSSNIYSALYYTKNTAENQEDFMEKIFNCGFQMPAEQQKESFSECLASALGDKLDFEVVKAVNERISDLLEEHKNSGEDEPLLFTKSAAEGVLSSCGIEEESVEAFGESYDEVFGENAEISPENMIDVKKFEVKTPDVVIKVNPEKKELVSVEDINGTKYIMIRADDNVEVNGMDIKLK